MTVEEIVEEYGLTVDDLRYYLAYKLAEEFLTYQEDPHGLARTLWSGEAERRLYNMADRFLETEREELARNSGDESRLRERLREALEIKRRRPAR